MSTETSVAEAFSHMGREVSPTGGVEVKEYTIEQKIARAVASCAAVAKLYRTYGGAFVQHPANTYPTTRQPFKTPLKSGCQIKYTVKLQKAVSVPRVLFCRNCTQPFLGATHSRCQCKATVQRRRAG